MRLFVAIELPEETRRSIFEKLVKRIPSAGFKRVEEGNLHITLSFIGESTEQFAEETRERLSKIKFAGFEAELCGVGSFGGRVIWLGVNKGENDVRSLAEKVSAATGTDGARFHAHVTLARARDADAEAAKKTVAALSEAQFAAKIRVNGFALMESKLSPRGPAYGGLFWASASTLPNRDSGS